MKALEIPNQELPSHELACYLSANKYLDWDHPNVLKRAKLLAQNCSREEDVVKACFEYVRDNIKHSWDYKLNPVTCKASDVLNHQTGYCYAKSHLLAALIRANNIPAALCYQRLTITDVPPFCLHGLNAVYLKAHGWYRIDSRGNKEGINAEFCPPKEALAFSLVRPGEMDLPGIYAEPLTEVITILEAAKDIQEVFDNLPDVEPGQRTVE